MINNLINEYDVKLNEIKKGDKFCEANGEECYHNQSYSAGGIENNFNGNGAEIWLGFYDNDEHRLLSFFHEMGHLLMTEKELNTDLTMHQVEKAAWRHGYVLARKHNIEFSEDAVNWGKEQLKTYKNWEKKETVTHG